MLVGKHGYGEVRGRSGKAQGRAENLSGGGFFEYAAMMRVKRVRWLRHGLFGGTGVVNALHGVGQIADGVADVCAH